MKYMLKGRIDVTLRHINSDGRYATLSVTLVDDNGELLELGERDIYLGRSLSVLNAAIEVDVYEDEPRR